MKIKLKKMAKIMEDKGVSYRELEKLTGIPSSTLQRYVNGTTEKLPIDRMIKIAAALKVSADYIFGDSGELAKQDESSEEHFQEVGLSYSDYLVNNLRLATIPDEVLCDEMEEADEYLVTTAHEICGMITRDISHCIAAGTLKEIWNPQKIYAITNFLKDNEKTLHILIDATDNKLE